MSILQNTSINDHRHQRGQPMTLRCAYHWIENTTLDWLNQKTISILQKTSINDHRNQRGQPMTLRWTVGA